jgi:AAA+ ATPase superfamily predicted ATPase
MCITSAADKVIGEAPEGGKKAWFDEECQEASRKKNEVYRQILQRRTRAREEEYWHPRGAEKRIHQRKKRAFFNEEMKELETARREKAVRLLYKKVNTTRQNFKPRITV